MRAAMGKRLGIEHADINTSPEQVTGYIATLKAHGMKARYMEVPQATHDAGILGTKLLQDVVTAYLLKKIDKIVLKLASIRRIY